jgi:2-oxoglutarate ferredoxin oxidoreductase subunit beta
MSVTESTLRARDYKSDVKPVWCPGCGDFGVLNALTKALATLELAPERVALVSGIGCSARLPAYMGVYGFHGIHGRALPVATGLKAARPELTVIAAGGDGDGFSIGGNHFLHACRRDTDLTYIVMDNEIYGMTKGQASPTTDAGWTGSDLTPQGPGAAPVRPLELALASGASYVARSFSGDPNGLARTVAEAIRHPGFAFIQVLSPCITYRPEQMQYKKHVHAGFEPTADRAEAFTQLAQDDHMTAGVVYRRGPEGPAPGERPVEAAVAEAQDLEAAFRV